MTTYIQGDARALPFPDGKFACAVTSPPYFGLRQYGDHPDEIGRGSLDAYVKEIVDAAAEVWRVLQDDGLFWLNIGETWSGSGGAGGDYNRGGSKSGNAKWKQGDVDLKPMQACLVPYRVALALQDEGWLVRQTIIWDKGRVRPEDINHVRRPLISQELILMLAKTRKHRFHAELLPERGNVWHFPPVRGTRAHLAPFPEELPRRCIEATTVEGDWVLDPFCGTGCTVKMAHRLGRHGVGVDLYQESS